MTILYDPQSDDNKKTEDNQPQSELLFDGEQSTSQVEAQDNTKTEEVQEKEKQNHQEMERQDVDDDIDDIDPALAGKSKRELAKMYKDSQSMIGKQGSQIGEYRQFLENVLKDKDSISPKKETKPKADIYENPEQFVNEAISENSTLKEMREMLEQQQKQVAVDRLTAVHPDWNDIANNTSFQEWVGASGIRLELFKRFNDYDFDAANELLSLWKEIVGTQQKAKDTAVKERKSQLKAASTGGTKGSAEKPSGKIYDARDLIDLHRRDPERYRLYADEITKAYAEGRVKR